MQRGFTKLFNTIVTSTIWQEDNETRILWITMLALADRFGEVSASVPGLASVAKISQRGCRKALSKLEAPDPDSRTPDAQGRRIKRVPGGWLVINYPKYRQMMNEEERRAYKARWIKERRKHRVDKMSTNVGESRHIAEAEAIAEASAASAMGSTEGDSTPSPDFNKLRVIAKEEVQKLKQQFGIQ